MYNDSVSSMPEEHFLYSTGPFKVRVFSHLSYVEQEATDYLIDRKYFGFGVDYGESLGINSIFRPDYSDAFRAILSKLPELISIDKSGFDPQIPALYKPENMHSGDEEVQKILGQIALFDDNDFRGQKRFVQAKKNDSSVIIP